MKNKIGKLSRILVAVCALGLVAVLFVPLWRIDLVAPQYPEGLRLLIFPDRLGGNVDIINGLNHYIGMKTIHKADFREFVYLPVAILSFMGLGVAVLLLNRKVSYYLWTAIFLVLGLVSFYDFYKWEYDYGHNLNPDAPIKVPGMVYQPPLLGYKKMLNFEALSQPHIGGWCFIFAGVLLVAGSYYEWRKNTRP